MLRAMAAFDGSVPIVYLHMGDERDCDGEGRPVVELVITGQDRFLVPQLALCLVRDASVMPSLHEEFGTTAAEAMGAGVASVLADVQGLRVGELTTRVSIIKPESFRR